MIDCIYLLDSIRLVQPTLTIPLTLARSPGFFLRQKVEEDLGGLGLDLGYRRPLHCMHTREGVFFWGW